MPRSTLDSNRALPRAATAALAVALGSARLAAAQEPREAARSHDARQREITPETALDPNAGLPVGADRLVPNFQLAPVDPAELAAAARRRAAGATRTRSGDRR